MAKQHFVNWAKKKALSVETDEAGRFRSPFTQSAYLGWSELEAQILKALHLPAHADVVEATWEISNVRHGWSEAAVAWAVCSSIHREFGAGVDPHFRMRQSDYRENEKCARSRAQQLTRLVRKR